MPVCLLRSLPSIAPSEDHSKADESQDYGDTNLLFWSQVSLCEPVEQRKELYRIFMYHNVKSVVLHEANFIFLTHGKNEEDIRAIYFANSLEQRGLTRIIPQLMYVGPGATTC